MENNMICKKCGAVLPDGIPSCPACGTDVGKDNNSSSAGSSASFSEKASEFFTTVDTTARKFSLKWAMLTCLKYKYADFKGRACRSEYWYFALGMLLMYIVLGFIVGILAFITGLSQLFFIISILPFVLLCPSLAVSVRRLHDLNYSGWWILGYMVLSMIPLVSFIVAIVYLVYMAKKGTAGVNRFGADPLV